MPGIGVIADTGRHRPTARTAYPFRLRPTESMTGPGFPSTVVSDRMRTVSGDSHATVIVSFASCPPSGEIDCGNSGTTLRLLAGVQGHKSIF